MSLISVPGGILSSSIPELLTPELASSSSLVSSRSDTRTGFIGRRLNNLYDSSPSDYKYKQDVEFKTVIFLDNPKLNVNGVRRNEKHVSSNHLTNGSFTYTEISPGDGALSQKWLQ